MKLKLLLVLYITSLLQQVHADPSQSCQLVTNNEISLCLPQNWQKIPQKNIEEYRTTIAEDMGRAPLIKYVFQEEYEDWFVYPYVIINPTLDASLSETFRNDPSKLINGIGTSEFEIKTTASLSGAPVFSKVENIVWIRMDNENNDGTKIVSITGLHLLPKGLISVTVYSEDEEYNTKEKLFLEMIKSVKIK